MYKSIEGRRFTPISILLPEKTEVPRGKESWMMVPREAAEGTWWSGTGEGRMECGVWLRSDDQAEQE